MKSKLRSTVTHSVMVKAEGWGVRKDFMKEMTAEFEQLYQITKKSDT